MKKKKKTEHFLQKKSKWWTNGVTLIQTAYLSYTSIVYHFHALVWCSKHNTFLCFTHSFLSKWQGYTQPRSFYFLTSIWVRVLFWGNAKICCRVIAIWSREIIKKVQNYTNRAIYLSVLYTFMHICIQQWRRCHYLSSKSWRTVCYFCMISY